MGCSHLPREGEFMGQRGQEEPVSNIQLGKESSLHLQSAQPELCLTVPEPGKSPGAAGAEGILASTFPMFWCIPAQESSTDGM